MQRFALVCLLACGAPTVERGAPEPTARDRDDVRGDAGVDAVKIVDTSIAAVWHREPAPEPHVQAPLGPSIVDEREEPEPERIARAMPRARVPGRRAPCFAKRDVLVGSQVLHDLADHAIGMSSDSPPSGRYGTCTIKNGELRDARGTLLAELHCGITIHVPGIIDERGFEVGASTTEIAAEFPTADAICWGEEQARARCWFFERDESGDAEWQRSHYTVAASIAGDEPLRGADARAFFVARKVSQITVRMSCH